MNEKKNITLSKALLVFWRTILSVACQTQTSIVSSFKMFGFEDAKIQNCLKNLFSARQDATLSSDDCLLLQHDKLIIEQLGIPPSETCALNRCTLGVLSKILYNFDGKNHLSDQEYKKICTESIDNLSHSYYLLSASKNADIYLNVAFGLLLDDLIHDKRGFCVRYNNDKKNIFDLVAVDLIRGSVENSVFCSSDCLFQEGNGTFHSSNCKCRGASWLLLTFIDKMTGEKRQIHCDVAVAAYKTPTFYDQHHPYPCDIGFIPLVDEPVRCEFEQKGWPIGVLKNVQVTKTSFYHRISSYDCVLPVRSHYDYICNVMNCFESLIEKKRTIVLMWHTLQRALSANDRVNAKKILEQLEKTTSIEEIQKILAEFFCIVDVNTEAQSLKIFLQALPLFLKF